MARLHVELAASWSATASRQLEGIARNVTVGLPLSPERRAVVGDGLSAVLAAYLAVRHALYVVQGSRWIVPQPMELGA